MAMIPEKKNTIVIPLLYAKHADVDFNHSLDNTCVHVI